MTMLAMKGSESSIKYGMPMLMAMAASMLATSSTGTDKLRKDSAMMTSTAAMDQMLTFLKSSSAISTRSFIMAPSPVTRPSGSASLTRRTSSSTCAFSASLPDL